jgi:CDP-4-dehydro-6-deoxyglucose reductase
MLLKLQLPATERLQFLAGQYIDIILRDGRRRGFSLANAPHDDDFLELHVRHVPGGKFTDQVFGDLKLKSILRFEGPLGGFYLREDSDRPLILMGGGTGFAPLKSIIEHSLQAGLERPIHLYWGVRARKDLYLDALAIKWASKLEHLRYVPVLSEPQAEDQWQGRTGFVHQAVCDDHPDLADFDVYMSGPPAMVDAARKAFPNHGLPDDQLFYDVFDYASDTLDALGKR